MADQLPDEPGGYSGYQALFGNKYLAPELGGGKPELRVDGYQVTNAAGNLVDENGNEMDGEYAINVRQVHTPDSPATATSTRPSRWRTRPTCWRSGVQVVNMYISDLHGNEFIQGLSSKGEPCYRRRRRARQRQRLLPRPGGVLQPGVRHVLQAAGRRGHHAAEHAVRAVSSDEGDHEAGANVGRAIQPTPANCDGVTTQCTYPAGTFGELEGNVTGLLAEETGDTTQFGMEYDTAPEYYINGDPAESSPEARKFDRDVAVAHRANPYAGGPPQKIANYLADPTEEAILHMVNADPARTPTLAEFAKPDYYLQQGSATCNASVTGTSTGDYPADCVSVRRRVRVGPRRLRRRDQHQLRRLRRSRRAAPRPRRVGSR